MEIIAATNNANKIREIKEIFCDAKIISLKEAGIDCDPDETGNTYEENALIKARAIFSIAKKPVLSDDSGLSVNFLGGRPGVYSARYSGVHGDNDANNVKLLSELEGVTDRRAEFVSAVAFVSEKGEFVCEGRVEGEILTEKSGEGGFGYDPLFYSYDLKKSFGVATAEEKNRVSHRGRALRALSSLLKEQGVLDD
ncbi:MAG: RdgB/HAM1 family non-canonical purine NTP pyrophosphatase [Clostridiales bacterium]|nr:RdgB/HAM1 family non-canonical purine NTP pyrophosphatase [Clostridiales bacterium]